MPRAIMISAASSGSGKTTLTVGLLRAFMRKGIAVQPCKCGPDYIDTQYHKIACGVDSINLDIWMNGEKDVEQSLSRVHDKDFCIIEGAMGLYDGTDGMQGSAAQVAELLRVPVVLVINALSMAHSVAPLLYGYLHWRPETRVAGVIFNNVGSERHRQMLLHAAQEVGIHCFGCIPRQRELYSPSRYLGLDISETSRINKLADTMANLVAQHIDLDALMLCAQDISCPTIAEEDNIQALPYNIYVARDEAFNFIYADTLHMLNTLGPVHFFSPLQNETVPLDADVVYLPGGYPEFYLERLSSSTATQESLRQTNARIVAECGGMMYLGENIDQHRMTGLLPIITTMQDARLHLGYRQLHLSDGTELRGHEFHYSHIESSSLTSRHVQRNAQDEDVDTALYIYNKVIAGYTHWSPASLMHLIQTDIEEL